MQPTPASTPASRSALRLLAAAVLVLVWVWSPSAWGGSRPASPASERSAFTVRTLPSGLVVIVREDRAVPAVAVTALVGAGSVDETPAEGGSAHFLEHLLFNGTTRRTQAQLYQEVNRLGLYSNAFTRRDYTAFQVLGRSATLAEMIDIQADMLFGSTLPPEAFEKERGIILEEIAKDASGPRDAVREAFEDQVLQAPRATGTEATVSSIARERVRDFYRERYVPSNVVVLVNGAVDAEAVFGAWQRAIPRRKAAGRAAPRPLLALPFAAPGAAALALKVDGEVEPTALLVFPAPTPGEPELAAALVLERALGEALSSAQAGAEASVALDLSTRTPLLVVTLRPVPGEATAADAARRLESWLAGSAPALLDDERIQRAATALRAEEVVQAEQPHYYAFFRAELLAGRDIATLEALQALPASVPAQAVRGLAERLLAGPRLLVVSDGSGAQPQGLAPGQEAAPLAVAVAPLPAVVRADASASGPILSRSVLPSGLTLLTEHAQGAQVASVVVILRDKGQLEERHCAPGAAEVLHRALPEGTLRRTASEIQADLSSLGATLKVVDDPYMPFDDYQLSPEFGFVRAKAPAASAEDLFRLVAELLVVPALSQEALETARGGALQALRSAAKSPRPAAAAAFDRQVGRQRAWPARGTLAGVERCLPEVVSAFARSYLAPGNLIVSVTGPLSHERVAQLAGLEWRDAGRLFAGAPTQSLPEGVQPPCVLADETAPAGTAQSWVLLGEALSAEVADSPELAAATAYLSDRVAFAVREEEGLAYSIGAGLSGGAAPWWRVSFGTRPENVERAASLTRAAVAAELDGVFDESAFAASVQRQASRLLMRRLPSDNRAFQAGVDESRGRPPGDAREWTERFAGVTPEEARAAAAAVLHPKQWAAIVAP